jgi:EAL domain-containing protein (putative c-di-GMP-specific phosphodiesterase class I)
MSRQNMTAMIALAVFPLIAVGAAAYLIAVNAENAAAISGGLLILAAGLFALIMVLSLRFARQDEGRWFLEDRLKDVTAKLGEQGARLEALEKSANRPQVKLDEIMSDVRILRDTMREMAGRKPEMQEQPVHRTAAASAANAFPASSQLQSSMPPAPAPPREANEHLELLLEPVIELSTGTTTHYRTLLDLTDDLGHVVRHADLMAKADKGGMRPALDAHMVKLVTPVLRRLRNKNPAMRAFVPIGISTLASREDTARIVANLERDVDIAGGIIFEFEHRGLGQLTQAGIENLARLGRLGATMALSNVQIAGLDLAALRQLGVRFLSFPPSAADSGFGPSPAWREFVQYARAMQFQIVVSDVTTPQQANAATHVGRFAFGSFFAPPRKVRADAGQAALNRGAAAA